MGEQKVKNISTPVRVYIVMLDGIAAKSATLSDKPANVSDKPSIAVLPFDNLSGDPEQEYFSDGITEDIITALSRIHQFFVIARNTTFTYKGQAVDVQAVAKELGVRYVLEGSVRKSGNRIRISAQLIDGETGNHLWAEKYDRNLDDIFDLQDEITGTVVGTIEPELTRAEWQRSKSKDPEHLDAWDYVVQAVSLISEFSDESSATAANLLDRAIEIDPSYARAYGHSAWISVWRAIQGWEDMGAALKTASATSSRAIQLDVNEPWAYIARVFIGFASLDNDLALGSARKALDISPNFAYARALLGIAHAFNGQGDKGISEIDQAIRLSPRDIWREQFDLYYAFANFQLANFAEAEKWATSASLPCPGHMYPLLLKAASFGLLDEIEKAHQAVDQIQSNMPNYSLKTAERSRVFIFDDDQNRLIDGLRKAGVPEG